MESSFNCSYEPHSWWLEGPCYVPLFRVAVPITVVQKSYVALYLVYQPNSISHGLSSDEFDPLQETHCKAAARFALDRVVPGQEG